MPSKPVNAINAVAGLFEALSEVDQKFVKVVDKECESVSSDLKKWFKKLAVRLSPSIYYA